MSFLKKIDLVFAKIFINIIRAYQHTLSPDKGIPSLRLKWRVCSHEPHCSQYSINVLRRYWFAHWIFKATDRVLHCTPKMNKVYDPDHYKIVFFSSAPIWTPFLEELNSDPRFEVVWVVTQCDKPSGRGLTMCENIIKTCAKTLDNPECWNPDFIATPTKLNPEKSEEWKQFYERLKNKEPDFLVVIAYGKIIPQAILDIPKFAPINIHGSLLPKYRWASPIQSCLLNKETETWITIMKMDASMDTWDMIEKLKFQIPLNRTSEDIIQKMQETWPKFLWNVLRKYGKRLLWEEKQDNDKATYCEKIEKEDWLIDPFKNTLDDIYSKYRAFYIRPKVHFMLNDKRVIIEKITVDENKFEENKNKSLFMSSLTKEGVPTKWVVDSLNPCITEILLKPEWKKAMPRKEFLNGYLK